MFGAISAKSRTFDMQIYFAIPPNSASQGLLEEFFFSNTCDDFNFEKDMAILSTLPRQKEWEAYVAQFQGCAIDARSDEKWHLCSKIFDSEK